MIKKYDISSVNVLELPIGSKILKAGVQNSKVMVWVLETDKVKVKYYFSIVGTGWETDDTWKRNYPNYLDTVFINRFVWHVFYGV